LSPLKSTSTRPPTPRLWLQVTVRVVPPAQVTAVFGAVTRVREVMLKLTSLMSVTEASPAQVARMRAVVVVGPGTVHEYVTDVAGVVVTVVSGPQVVPPSRLSSRLMFCPLPSV